MCIRDRPNTLELQRGEYKQRKCNQTVRNHTRHPDFRPTRNTLVIFLGRERDDSWMVEAVDGLLQFNGQKTCLLYTSDAADERSSVDLGGRRIIKKKKKTD